MAVEVAAGIVARSLALISDAAHMLTDAAAIVVAGGVVGVGAVRPAGNPDGVAGWDVLLAGGGGLAVNAVAAWAIGKANRASLNIQGAYQHVLMDALASLAAIAAGAVV